MFFIIGCIQTKCKGKGVAVVSFLSLFACPETGNMIYYGKIMRGYACVAGGGASLKQLQFFITAVWGFLTPSFALDGAKQFLIAAKGGAEAQGNSTPTEYVLWFLLAVGGCVLVFLLFDALFSRFALPKDGRRFLHFLLNFVLYAVLVPAGWFAVVFLVSVMGL